MACTQTLSGLTKDCAPNIGGIKAAWVANFADVEAVSLTDGKISAFTMATSAKFKKYDFRPGSSTFNSTLNVSPDSGVNYVSTDIQLVFAKMETQKRVEMAALSQGELALIVLDNNGIYWYFGYDEGVVASAGSGATGTARGDANAYGITLQDNSKSWPYEILASVITSSIVDRL